MTAIARGTVADRAWGKTLARIGLGGHSGQLSLTSDGKRYDIAFMQGAVVSAASPLAADAAVRVAITGHLISSSQIGDIARRQAAAPGRDEVDVIADLAKLGPDHTRRLRRRVIAQRAARTFSVDRGDFVLDDKITLKITPGCELDIRAIVFMGARSLLAETRLVDELDSLGGWFRIKQSAQGDLAQFGFGEPEQAVLSKLAAGATISELESLVHGIADSRTVRAVVYALASCGACDTEAFGARPGGMSRPPPTPTPPPRPVQSDLDSQRRRASTGPGRRDPDSERRRASTGPVPRDPDSERRRAAGPTPAPEAERSRDVIISQRKLASSRPPPARSVRPSGTEAIHAHDVVSLIAQRLKLLDQGVDHFKLLGVTPESPQVDVRKAYFALARKLHPDRLSALGIPDEGRHAQRLFAHVNTAFAVLSDPRRRGDYVDIMRRGGEAAVREEQARAEELAGRILEAEEAYRRGEMALRRDQINNAIAELNNAIELNPDEPDYHAVLAWAQFCAAPDKAAAARPTRVALDRQIQRAPRSVTARFYLGRVERILGRDTDALRWFQEVLHLRPNHAEAAGEVRAIEARSPAGRSRRS